MSIAPTSSRPVALAGQPMAVAPGSRLRGGGFWGGAWRRYRRKPVAMFALGYIVFLTLVALGAPVLVGTKPIVCRYQGRIYFPCLGYFHPSLENPIFRRDKFRIPF